eukprot:366228-Chlamydomonas_euryale.AAC.14
MSAFSVQVAGMDDGFGEDDGLATTAAGLPDTRSRTVRVRACMRPGHGCRRCRMAAGTSADLNPPVTHKKHSRMPSLFDRQRKLIQRLADQRKKDREKRKRLEDARKADEEEAEEEEPDQTADLAVLASGNMGIVMEEDEPPCYQHGILQEADQVLRTTTTYLTHESSGPVSDALREGPAIPRPSCMHAPAVTTCSNPSFWT